MNVQAPYRDHQEPIRRIDSRLISRGAALPSEASQTKKLGVSLITIRRAIHEMELDGLIIRRQGMGNFVRDLPRNGLVIGLSTFTSSVASGRLQIVGTLLVDDHWP